MATEAIPNEPWEENTQREKANETLVSCGAPSHRPGDLKSERLTPGRQERGRQENEVERQ